MDCPRCNSDKFAKDCIVKNRQRYKCKKCNYHYTVQKRSPRIHPSVKRFAIELYLEGLGFRAIERLLGVSNVSVMNWVAEFANRLEPLKSLIEPTLIEIDELHSYISSKKNTAGFGLLLIDLNAGSSVSLLATGAKNPA